MNWRLEFHHQFHHEFDEFSGEVQDNILSKSLLIQRFGPHLGRPHVDTLKGSKHPNMKELRLDVEKGVWRIAFAFDPERKAILLVAGDKAGKSKKRFYKSFISKADKRFDEQLENLKSKKEK